MIGTDFLRELQQGEEASVDALLANAFGGQAEVRLVHALRRSKAIAGECVVPGAAGPVGYIALSDMRAPKGWLCLAPVAVAPDSQNTGIGRRMVGLIGAWAVAARRTIVVLGDPEFYLRTGFSSVRASRLTGPYPIEHTLLARAGDDTPEAQLIYPRAFDS